MICYLKRINETANAIIYKVSYVYRDYNTIVIGEFKAPVRLRQTRLIHPEKTIFTRVVTLQKNKSLCVHTTSERDQKN